MDLGRLLVTFWATLVAFGCLWATFGHLWAHFGRTLGVIGAPWAPIGSPLDAFSRLWRPKGHTMPQQGQTMAPTFYFRGPKVDHKIMRIIWLFMYNPSIGHVDFQDTTKKVQVIQHSMGGYPGSIRGICIGIPPLSFCLPERVYF